MLSRDNGVTPGIEFPSLNELLILKYEIMIKEKYLLIALIAMENGREYNLRIPIIAYGDTWGAAELYAKNFWGECNYIDDGAYYFFGGETSIRVNTVHEISKEMYEQLKELFY